MPSETNVPALSRPLTLMLVCGEPSGDQLGGELMAGLKVIAGHQLNIVGVGGPAMEAQGLQSLFPLDDTAVMGLREVVPRIPAILRRVRQAADYALTIRPDAVVLIDSPDFTHRIAQRIKSRDRSIRTVNYVAPQVWASRRYRARRMAKYFDLIIALLPFEVPFFEGRGLHAVFAGHPVIERASRMNGGDALRDRLCIARAAPLLLILPGSRMNEVRLLLPRFRQAVERVGRDVAELVCVLPTVPHVRDYVRAHTADWPTPLHIVEGDADKFAAFAAGDVALAASGTVTTELALARVPMVVAYRLGWLTYALARPFVSVKYITLVNLLLDRQVVPELIQERCTGDALAAELLPLFRDTNARERQKTGLAEATAMLGTGAELPSRRAARALLEFVRAQPSAMRG
ncbi:MAG: lipid-A-disaccharide synthase [Rhizomicrobium sp.]